MAPILLSTPLLYQLHPHNSTQSLNSTEISNVTNPTSTHTDPIDAAYDTVANPKYWLLVLAGLALMVLLAACTARTRGEAEPLDRVIRRGERDQQRRDRAARKAAEKRRAARQKAAEKERRAQEKREKDLAKMRNRAIDDPYAEGDLSGRSGIPLRVLELRNSIRRSTQAAEEVSKRARREARRDAEAAPEPALTTRRATPAVMPEVQTRATLPRRPSLAMLQPGPPLDSVRGEVGPPPAYAPFQPASLHGVSTARARMLENGFPRQNASNSTISVPTAHMPGSYPVRSATANSTAPNVATALSSHPPSFTSTIRPWTPSEDLPAYTEVDPGIFGRFGGNAAREALRRERSVWEAQTGVREEAMEVIEGVEVDFNAEMENESRAREWREREARERERQREREREQEREQLDEAVIMAQALTGLRVGPTSFGGII